MDVGKLDTSKLLEQLSNKDWGAQVPSPDQKITTRTSNLENLEKISGLVQTQIKQTGTKTPTLEKVVEKCWNFSTHNKTGKDIITSCSLCHSVLGASNAVTLPINLKFKDGEITLPKYYLIALSNDSLYFESLFSKGADHVDLTSISKSDFLQILIAMYGDYVKSVVPSTDLPLTDPLKTPLLLNEYQLSSPHLETEVSIDQEDSKGFTSLHRACLQGDYNKVLSLLNNGADINHRFLSNGSKAIHFAAQGGNPKIFALLKSKGADVNELNLMGQSPLHFASTPEMIQSMQISTKMLNMRDKDGRTPLMFAVISDKPDLVRQLISMHADVSITNNKKMNVFHLACMSVDRDMLSLLVSSMKNNSMQMSEKALNMRDDEGCTPLMLAVIHDNTHAVKQLISMHADIGITDNKNKNVLHHACISQNDEMFDILLTSIKNNSQQIPEKVLNMKDDEGDTPLKLAIGFNYTQAVKQLISMHANIGITDNNKRNALHLACISVNEGMLDLLLSSMKDNSMQVPEKVLNMKDNDGNTPLMIAIYAKRTHAARKLFSIHADVRISNNKNWNVIHIACGVGSKEILDLILHSMKNNPSKLKLLNQFDLKGVSPLLIATVNDNTELVKILLEHGADPNLRMGSSKPIHDAMLSGVNEKSKTIELLRNKEINPHFPEFFLEEKMLCHRFGTNYGYSFKGKKYEMEGLTRVYSKLQLVRSLNEYISSTSHKEIDWGICMDILTKSPEDDAVKSSKLIKDTNEDIVSTFGGWQRAASGHAMGISYCKSQQIVLLSDRGTGLFKGMKAFRVVKRELAENELTTAIEKSNSPEGEELFFQLIQSKNLEEMPASFMSHKDQHAGNCTWASMKLMLRATIFLLLIKNDYSHEDASKLSYDIYKDFTGDDRIRALKAFIKAKNEIDTTCKNSNITPTLMKEEGIIPREILSEILGKCIRNRLDDGFRVLIKSEPWLLEKKFDVVLKENDRNVKKQMNAEELVQAVGHKVAGRIIQQATRDEKGFFTRVFS